MYLEHFFCQIDETSKCIIEGHHPVGKCNWRRHQLHESDAAVCNLIYISWLPSLLRPRFIFRPTLTKASLIDGEVY
mgnify:CR=1 FL=1